jgi:hypothetical protein
VTFAHLDGNCWTLLIGVDSMHGGMKPYRGSAAAARNYVEAGRARADDYYLAEGTGIAERYLASPETGVRRVAPLTGDAYEAWVAGFNPETGEPKGRLRHDDHAVRFVEVGVNGPKSWSLAAELHPDISAAYYYSRRSLPLSFDLVRRAAGTWYGHRVSIRCLCRTTELPRWPRLTG